MIKKGLKMGKNQKVKKEKRSREETLNERIKERTRN